jgi:hypothetical protein
MGMRGTSPIEARKSHFGRWNSYRSAPYALQRIISPTVNVQSFEILKGAARFNTYTTGGAINMVSTQIQ